MHYKAFYKYTYLRIGLKIDLIEEKYIDFLHSLDPQT